MGSDVAGSRPYRPGDDVDAIDWASSAKLSAARGQDEFIVRERYADEAPYVVCVLDRRPSMAHMAAPLPWLSKPDAMRISIDLVTQAAAQARSLVGYVDFKGSEPTWSPPTSERETRELGEGHRDTSGFDAPANAMSLALAHLAEHRRSLPSGSFVFLFSDFVEVPSERAVLLAVTVSEFLRRNCREPETDRFLSARRNDRAIMRGHLGAGPFRVDRAVLAANDQAMNAVLDVSGRVFAAE